ncbi:histidinol-phosphate phosphatase [Motilibacter rhizosphaerae]|uniref:Histidinol-phosphatase n=1 Tax=Motilibacter rhizosphaerae TaxID=598652 RepID=A0A4Q7NPF2_9ACTN|nr:inositol monophosphatase family protein [Motilibacter rhizosphaerae]RZS87149.1 histidinol-phosphate phosphatase [Motilibacter rhizosphaerae]
MPSPHLDDSDDRDDRVDDLALAHAVADACDAITLARFRALDLQVSAKPDATPVSDADTAAERAARELLARERPGDAVHGEEYADTGSGPRRWVLDPIDGTKNYVRGVPVWATLVALALDGEVVVSVVSAPALGRRWWAARGTGAYAGTGPADGTRLAVSQVARLADASVSYSDLVGWGERRGAWLGVLDGAWRTRAYGDFWSYALLAEGVVDAAAEPDVALHDLAALDLLVREAGGRFTDLTGRPGPGHGSALASNGLLHDALLARLA